MKKFEVKWVVWSGGERVVGLHTVEAESKEIAYSNFHFNYPDYLIEFVREAN